MSQIHSIPDSKEDRKPWSIENPNGEVLVLHPSAEQVEPRVPQRLPCCCVKPTADLELDALDGDADQRPESAHRPHIRLMIAANGVAEGVGRRLVLVRVKFLKAGYACLRVLKALHLQQRVRLGRRPPELVFAVRASGLAQHHAFVALVEVREFKPFNVFSAGDLELREYDDADAVLQTLVPGQVVSIGFLDVVEGVEPDIGFALDTHDGAVGLAVDVVGERLSADQLAVVVLKVAELRLNVLVGNGLEGAGQDDAVADNGADAVEFGAEKKVVVGDFVPFDWGSEEGAEISHFASLLYCLLTLTQLRPPTLYGLLQPLQ